MDPRLTAARPDSVARPPHLRLLPVGDELPGLERRALADDVRLTEVDVAAKDRALPANDRSVRRQTTQRYESFFPRSRASSAALTSSDLASAEVESELPHADDEEHRQREQQLPRSSRVRTTLRSPLGCRRGDRPRRPPRAGTMRDDRRGSSRPSEIIVMSRSRWASESPIDQRIVSSLLEHEAVVRAGSRVEVRADDRDHATAAGELKRRIERAGRSRPPR